MRFCKWTARFSLGLERHLALEAHWLRAHVVHISKPMVCENDLEYVLGAERPIQAPSVLFLWMAEFHSLSRFFLARFQRLLKGQRPRKRIASKTHQKLEDNLLKAIQLSCSLHKQNEVNKCNNQWLFILCLNKLSEYKTLNNLPWVPCGISFRILE